MISISLCMIVKDEEATLERCLLSVINLVDECIIVDTGSSDSTKEIAYRYTDKVYDFPWVDDFSAARNYSFQQATMEYILWLDADDMILPEDNVKFQELKETMTANVNAIRMRYHTAYDEYGNVVFSYYRERLVRRASYPIWREPVHEYIEVLGSVVNVDIAVSHGKLAKKAISTRNLAIYKGLIQKGENLSPRGQFYYGRELYDHGEYEEAMLQLTEFLKQERGFKEDRITACRVLSNIYVKQGKEKDGIKILLESFLEDLPRGETCCDIGFLYMNQGEYERAAFWFDLSLHLEIPKNCIGFISKDYWRYLPAIQCAVCYDKLGEKKRAEEYNNLALQYKPNAVEALNNKTYFMNIKNRSV